jgi:hypothetical protein
MRTFRSAKDCETFILQEVPGGILNTYWYDMVSLLYRIRRKGTKVSATDGVANKAAVRKGGFPNAASQMIHNSYQTALPGPLNVTALTTSSAEHPIPALPGFKAWDMVVDGVTVLGPELLHEVGLTSTKIFASLAMDCAAHPTATAMFESMILRSSLQFMALATFITSNHNQALTVGGDESEAHRFSMEVVSGIFSRCHKVRSRAADRTTMVYSVADARWSMWAALKTMELLSDMIALKYTGHPLLSPYTVSHLYRHRVARKELLVAIDKQIKPLTTEVH